VYPALLNSIRALIYNGDTDLACNFFGDQQFVDGLQRAVKVKRSPWNVDGQVAGFVKEYDQIAFTTVLGAGHMVPQDRPAPAYHLFDCFLNHKPL
jgi:cathepsin A (carboxypeptidase C)